MKTKLLRRSAGGLLFVSSIVLGGCSVAPAEEGAAVAEAADQDISSSTAVHVVWIHPYKFAPAWTTYPDRMDIVEYRSTQSVPVTLTVDGSFMRTIAPGARLRVRFPNGKHDVRVNTMSRTNIITVGEEEPEANLPGMG